MGSATTGIGPLLIALAVAALTPIRGFGICSAQTFFIHDVARPAVMPARSENTLRSRRPAESGPKARALLAEV
jgi:hypothetical protein